MQTRLLKILGLWIFLFPFLASGNPALHLKRADSLFTAKQYTQSFDNYLLVFQSGNYSPSMLLKMAFIQEGLGHVSQAIYYLQHYYKTTHDQQALEKIAELSARYKLEGYQTSGFSLLMDKINRYQIQVYGVFGAGLILLLAVIAVQKKKGLRPQGAIWGLMVVACLFLVQINVLTPPHYGIVGQPATYLMSGPSAGASVVAIIEEGHQLKIEGREDVWLRVKWLDKVAFIKEDRVLQTQL